MRWLLWISLDLDTSTGASFLDFLEGAPQQFFCCIYTHIGQIHLRVPVRSSSSSVSAKGIGEQRKRRRARGRGISRGHQVSSKGRGQELVGRGGLRYPAASVMMYIQLLHMSLLFLALSLSSVDGGINSSYSYPQEGPYYRER